MDFIREGSTTSIFLKNYFVLSQKENIKNYPLIDPITLSCLVLFDQDFEVYKIHLSGTKTSSMASLSVEDFSLPSHLYTCTLVIALTAHITSCKQ